MPIVCEPRLLFLYKNTILAGDVFCSVISAISFFLPALEIGSLLLFVTARYLFPKSDPVHRFDFEVLFLLQDPLVHVAR